MVNRRQMQQWINLLYYAIRWNAFESLFYQSIYIFHQIILFKVVSNFDYSQVGIIISAVYLAISILNFGLDRSFITYFKDYSQSRYVIRKVIFSQLIIQILINTAFLTCLYYATIKLGFLNFLNLNSKLFVFISLMFLLESLKKSLKVIAQLYFLNKITAILEIFSISLYVCLFWLLYFFAGLSHVALIALVPLCIESTISVIFLSYVLSKIYISLNNNDKNLSSAELNAPDNIFGNISGNISGSASGTMPGNMSGLSPSGIITNRFNIFTTQLTGLMFSSNLLVPIIGYKFGLESIAVIQLSKSVVAFLVFFFEKTFGITTGSFLSRVKSEDLKTKQDAFDRSSTPIYKSLFFVLSIFLAIFSIFSICAVYFLNLCNLETITNSFLFIVAILTTSFFIPQEQFLIVEKKTYYLSAINLINGAIFYLFAINFFNLTTLLIFFIASRFISLLILDKLIEYKIRIKIKYHDNIYVPMFVILVSFCILSLIIFYHCQK